MKCKMVWGDKNAVCYINAIQNINKYIKMALSNEQFHVKVDVNT